MHSGFRPESKWVNLLCALHANLKVFFHDSPVTLRHVLQFLLTPMTAVACAAANRTLPLKREFHSDSFILLHLSLVDRLDQLAIEFLCVLRSGNRTFSLLSMKLFIHDYGLLTNRQQRLHIFVVLSLLTHIHSTLFSSFPVSPYDISLSEGEMDFGSFCI